MSTGTALVEPPDRVDDVVGPSTLLVQNGLETRSDQQVAGEPVPASAWFGPAVTAAEERELTIFLGAHNGAAVLCWPRDRAIADRLALVGIPRLLILGPQTLPPEPTALQDWIPRPVERDGLHRRLVALCHRAANDRAASGWPVLDCDGRLHLGDRWTQLPPAVRRMAHALLTRPGEPAGVAELAAACFCEQRVVMRRMCWLSDCVNPLGLEIAHVPGGGYAMRRCPSISG